MSTDRRSFLQNADFAVAAAKMMPDDGGGWPSLNPTLIWAPAGNDGAMAWDEWKKNSFAPHEKIYPEIWCCSLSGPDVPNSASRKQSGETTGGKPFGIIKSAEGCRGCCNPVSHSAYSIRLNLYPQEVKSVSRIEVNGKATNIHPVNGAFEMRGQGGDATPLRWTVLRG
jgi:hypothetical protein